MKGGVMKKVSVVVLCLVLFPMLSAADNTFVESNEEQHFIAIPNTGERNYDKISEERQGWLTYDDGSPYWAVAWDSGGDGAGVEYVAPYDCVVGSISVFMGQIGWPDPGDNYITLRIYEEGSRGPGDVVWEHTGLWANRGVWNTYEVNVAAPPSFPFSHSMYVFYHQVGANPFCPSFSADNGCNYPDYSWTYWQLGGGFFNENPYGDWMIRTFVYHEPGVGEWLSHTPIEPEFIVNTIISGTAEVRFSLADPMYVELLVYDITGRERTTIVSQRYAAGTHVVTAQLDLPGGIYFVNLKTDTGFNIAKKFVVVQ